jgi:hypothetical protein
LTQDYRNLDSAYRYILYAEITFQFVPVKKRKAYQKFHFDSLAIQSYKQLVSDAFFELEIILLTENGLQNFIDKNSWSRQIDKAVFLRDSIAFFEVQKQDSTCYTLGFLTKYPNSFYASKANLLLQEQQFKETTQSGRIEDFERFINTYTGNFHVSDAENRIFELSTAKDDLKSYKFFVSNYPLNRNVNEAWKQIYRMYMFDFDSSKFDSFEKEFPDFPFKEDLKQDKEIFLENYFPVVSDQKFGYMNSNGRVVIEPQYDEVGVFRNGLAVVSKDSKYGIINKKNELIVDFIYDEILDFQEDRAIVIKGDTYNLVDRSGKEISSSPFIDLTSFSSKIYIGIKDSFYQFYDKNLNVLSDLKCQEIGNLQDGYSIIQIDNLFGVIDSNLQVKIPVQFHDIHPFHNGVFVYTVNGKKGLIRTDELKLTEPLYDDISDLNLENKTAVVRMGSSISWIKIDGTKLFDFTTEYFPNALELAQFSKGFAVFRKKGKYGLIDEKSKLAFKPSLESISKYINAIPIEKDAKWGLMDLKGKIIKSYEYDLIEDWNGKGIIVNKNGLSGLWDFKFSTILPLEFNSIKLFEDQFYIVTKGAKCGLYDLNGKQIIPVAYDRIQLFEKDCLTLINDSEISYYFIRTNYFLKQFK